MFQKISEMNIEFETAMSVQTPDGQERAKHWDKARTIAFHEIPGLLDRIEDQARTIITDKLNRADSVPSIEVTSHKNVEDYYLEVKNNGKVADFEAQIEVIRDDTGYTKDKSYWGYWEFGHGSKASIGNIDRIKIAHLHMMQPPEGTPAESNFAAWLDLYYCEQSGVGPPSLWKSTAITGNDGELQPEYVLKVTITSNPPLREGKFIRQYRLNFEGLSEIIPASTCDG